MLFVRNHVVVSNVIVFSVSTKASTVTIIVNGIFITLIWIKDFTSGAKASEGRHIKKSGCQYSTRKLESFSRAFLEVQGSDQHILVVGGTSPRQLDEVENTTFIPELTLFPFNCVQP